MLLFSQAKQRELGEKDADVSPEARGRYKKNLGNEAFKGGDHRQAAVFYTESILVLPTTAQHTAHIKYAYDGVTSLSTHTTA